MRNLALVSGFSAFILALGCSSTDSTTAASTGGAGAGGANNGGASKTEPASSSAIGGTTTSGGSGSKATGGTATVGTGTCDVPACLSNVISACTPSGTCVSQTDITTLSGHSCYSNGVKMVTSVNMTATNITMTVTNGNTPCYTMDITGTTTASGTIKNASGTTIATLAEDAAGNTVITCTGGQPVTLGANCPDPTGASDTTTCTTGTCT